MPVFLLRVKFTVKRAETKTAVITMNVILMPSTAGANDGGFTKFGITPGGGIPAGIFERSVPGGRVEAMSRETRLRR